MNKIKYKYEKIIQKILYWNQKIHNLMKLTQVILGFENFVKKIKNIL